MEEKALYLLLEDGTVFSGAGYGCREKEVTGEVVFTTGMTGYLETLTDPSYFGQIVVQTFPLIGNYGVIPADFESQKVQPTGYITRQWCQCPSNFRSEGDLDAFFKAQGLPALWDVDTRRLTRMLREHGVMNGRLTTKAPPYTREEVEEVKGFAIRRAVEAVSCTAPWEIPARGEERFHVVLWDFGAKANIGRELAARGCRVTVVPAAFGEKEILALRPDGLMLSNGPGDPAENTRIIGELARLQERKIPTFGICLGHQLLALANGARTVKLKYGHRGANQPVKELATGRLFITSQNHGYAVEGDTLPAGARLSFVNANDHTCEGVDYTQRPAFSVQFHPEACAGPHDTQGLFDRFTALMAQAGRGKEE